jgi:hypothetical protein
MSQAMPSEPRASAATGGVAPDEFRHDGNERDSSQGQEKKSKNED